jgi:hypothetical protein
VGSLVNEPEQAQLQPASYGLVASLDVRCYKRNRVRGVRLP